MVESIHHETRKSRKERRCNFCDCMIRKGETYMHSVDKFDGELYEWNTHLHCDSLCSAIWDYVDPDEGMTDYDFQEAVDEIMRTLYCPAHCDKYDAEEEGCRQGIDRDACYRKFAEFMETHVLSRIRGKHGIPCWIIEPRNKPEEKGNA